MDKSANNHRLLKAIGAVIGLLAIVGVGISYFLRPEFVVSWPKLETTGDQVVVRFDAENRTAAPMARLVRVSILDKREKRSHGVKLYESLGEREMTLELAPREKRSYEVDFPRPDREPSLAMVEPVGAKITNP